jgi:hypothetical protein
MSKSITETRRTFLRLAAGAGTLGVGGALLTACGGGSSEAIASGRESASTRVIGNCSSKAAAVVDDKGTTIGFIDFINDSTEISVIFFTADNDKCPLTDIKLWVGTDLANMPASNGAPAFAQFPHQQVVTDGAVQYDMRVPLSSLGLPAGALSCSSKPVTVYVVAQLTTTCSTGTVRGYSSPNNNGAFNFAAFELCCSDTVVLNGCETAFAKGGHVLASDGRANPEGLPSLGLTRNRWGWAIQLTSTGTTTYPIYAGAGLNKAANGKLVGTLTVAWDGANATVTYALNAGVAMTEAHLYAGDDKPTTIAPGAYGNTAYFPTPAGSHAFTVPLADSNGGGVWLIAHAVVC